MKAWRPVLLALATALLGTTLLPVPSARALTLFALVDTGELYASADTGTTWIGRAVLPVRDAIALAAGQTSSQLFLATRSGSVYRSTDAGTTWAASLVAPASDVIALSIKPSDATLLLLTESGSIYSAAYPAYSSFTALAALTGSDFVSLAATAGGTFYALTRTGDVYESTDGGTTWPAKGVVTTSEAVGIRSFGSSLYVVTGSGDVYKSTNAGAAWTPVGTLSQVGLASVAVVGPYLGVIYEGGETAMSLDGATWRWRGLVNQVTVQALGVDTPGVTGVGPGGGGRPLALRIGPNPRLGEAPASISLALDRPAAVTLSLYDAAGRLVAKRAPETFPAGPNEISWAPRVGTAGIYRVRVTTATGAALQAAWVLLP